MVVIMYCFGLLGIIWMLVFFVRSIVCVDIGVGDYIVNIGRYLGYYFRI